MLTPKVASILNQSTIPTPKLFNPTKSYFATLAERVSTDSLIQEVTARFPFQPPYAAFHPALNSDYLIEKSFRGSFFFLSDSYRDEKEFFNIVRRRAEHAAIVARHELLSQQREYTLKKIRELQQLAEKLKNADKFEELADKVHAQSDIFIELIAQSYWQSKKLLGERIQLRDKLKVLRHDLFWEAVYKNLEKEPQESPSSGTNIAALLNTLPEENNPAIVLGMLRRIKLNQLKRTANQIVERLSGNHVPAGLLGKVNNRFHRNTHEKEMRQEIKDLYAALHMETRKSYIDELDKKYFELKKERIEEVETRIRIYWEIIDIERQKLLVPMSLAKTNLNELLGMLKFKEPGVVLYGLEKIKENRTKARAAQLNDHIQSYAQEIFHFLNITFDYGEWVKEVAKENNETRNQYFFNQLRDQKINQDELFTEKREEIRTDLIARVEEHLKIIEKLYAIIRRPLVSSATNLAEILSKGADDNIGKVIIMAQNIKENKGYLPVNPLTSKNRKTNMSFQTGWLEFFNTPPTEPPEPREDLKLEFLPHKDPTDIYKKDLIWEQKLAERFQWKLQPQQFPDKLPQNAQELQPQVPIGAKRSSYERNYQYSLQEGSLPELPLKAQDELPRTISPWEFNSEIQYKIEAKPLMKNGVVLNRNKNDAVDYELDGEVKHKSQAEITFGFERHLEEKGILSKKTKIELYNKSQAALPVTFKNVKEHELAAHEMQTEIIRPLPLSTKTEENQIVFKANVQFVHHIDTLPSTANLNDRFMLNHPEPAKVKPKRKK